MTISGMGFNTPRWIGKPLTHITPMSLSDGATFERKLDWVYNYLVNTLVPELDGILDEWFEQYKKDHAELLDDIQDAKDGWQALFDQFMLDIVAQLEALNDQAVANLVNDALSKTRTALDDRYALLSDFENVVEGSSPTDNFDSVEIAAILPLRPANTSEWTQGFNINFAEGHVYVANQVSGGDYLSINRYTLAGEFVDGKTISIENYAYTESLPYWRGNDGQLRFIVRTGSHANTDNSALKVPQLQNTYNVFNFDSGNLGPRKNVKGAWRMSGNDEVTVTHEAWTSELFRFFFYDTESMRNNAPTLLKTVPVSNPGTTSAKNQGLAYTGSTIIMYGGDASEKPTFTQYDAKGLLIGAHSWEKSEFAKTVNALRPGTIENYSSYDWEAEGCEFIDGSFYSGHVVKDSGASWDSAKFIIVKHNSPGGKVVESTDTPVNTEDNTDWVNYGGSHISSFYLRRVGNVVYGRVDGSIAIADGVTTVLPSGAIPSALRPKTGHARFGLSASMRPCIGEVLSGGGFQVQNWTGQPHTSINGTVFSYDLLPFEKLERG